MVVMPTGPPLKVFDDHVEDAVIHFIQSVFIHTQCFQAELRDLHIYHTIAHHLRKVAHTAQQPIGNTRRATGAAGNFRSRRLK